MVDRHRSSLFLILSLLCLVLSVDLVVVVDERLTLLRLRSTLGLRGTDWPIKGDPCRLWRGIQCNSNGSIVGINISGLRRTRLGKQNPRFSVDPLVNLTSLAYFNASGFSLPGSLPDWFGVSLKSLRVLDLSSCSVTGIIPVTLGNLATLRSLNLSCNGLTGSVPSSFGGLLSISEIDLSANYLTGPITPGVGLLSKLMYLNLSSNSFSSSIPPELGDLVDLVVLDLSINSLSGSVPKELGKLTNLRKMVISDNLLSGALPADWFGANSKLESLVLRENGFSGNIPDAYWSLPMLKILDIARNNITGMLPNSSSGPNQIDAVVVDISSNTFYGELTGILTRFSTMDLSGNFFEGKVPDYVLRANASVTSNCLQNEKTQKSSEDCSSFYSSKGLDFDDFGRPNATSEKASSGISRRTVIILVAVGGGIGFILIFILSPILVALWIRRRGNNDRPTKPVNEASQPPKGVSQTIDLSRLGNAFAFEQLLQATEEFSEANLIKHGHSGSLFRGFLDNGTQIVIKKINMKGGKNEGYVSELEVLSKAGHHQRLVPFLGHCLENESQKVLVYKYMRNGDLGSALFRKSDNEGGDGLKSLDWITRLKIALGAAEGLAYLHHECSPPLVHRY